MKVQLKQYSGCHPVEFCRALERFFAREGIEKLDVLTLYGLPKLDIDKVIRIAKCDRLKIEEMPDDKEVPFA